VGVKVGAYYTISTHFHNFMINHIMLDGMVSPRANEDRLIVTNVYRESDQTYYSGAFRIGSDHSSIVLHDILYFMRYLSANMQLLHAFGLEIA
jgi:hypothetical protein